MKDPQVLIADEPTAALDAKTAHEIGALLTSIAKERTVIVVTHDISLIQGKCSVFELDKGVLIRSDKGDSTTKTHSRSTENLRLTMRSALRMAGVTGKRQMGKTSLYRPCNGDCCLLSCCELQRYAKWK